MTITSRITRAALAVSASDMAHAIGGQAVPETIERIYLRTFVCTAMCAAAFALAAHAPSGLAQTVAVTPPDSDKDGIPDLWERFGHGPLNPRIHDVRVGRHDFIFLAVRRPGLSEATVSADLAKVKAFYARLPVRNLDGTTGINMVVVNGPALTDADRATSYIDVYARGMPVAWRGIAHGYLLENATNVGGQASRGDWAASGYNWNSIVHELGHQFGLAHTAPGSGSSPLFTSLMSYNYAYSFNGDPNAIRFSSGEFSAFSLDERRLDEFLAFPIERLSFLQRELGFSLRSLGKGGTEIDWNRNGVFGEIGISADINDGYAVGALPGIEAGPAAGGLSMATVGSRLYLVYPRLSTPPAEWRESTPSASRAPIMVQEFDGGAAFTPPRELLVGLLYRDPVAAAFGARLAVSYILGGVGAPGFPSVALWSTSAAGLRPRHGAVSDPSQVADQATITASQTPVGVALRQRLWMFTWTASTRAIRAVEVTDAAAPGATPIPAIAPRTSHPIMNGASALSSDHPIGIAFDTLTNRMIMVTYETHWGQPDKIRVNTLRLNPNGAWVYESHRFVGVETSGEYGNTRPTIVLDPSKPIAGHSHITIYLRGGAAPNVSTQTFALREIADRSQNDGWRTRQMENEWTLTQSPPAAALFNGAHTFAFRWPHDGDRAVAPNKVVFFPRTGVASETLRDFNEIGWLESEGLVRSLEGVRAER